MPRRFYVEIRFLSSFVKGESPFQFCETFNRLEYSMFEKCFVSGLCIVCVDIVEIFHNILLLLNKT